MRLIRSSISETCTDGTGLRDGLLAEFSRLAGQCVSPAEVYLEMDAVLSRLLDYDRVTIRFVEDDSVSVKDAFVSGVLVSGFTQDSIRPLVGTITSEVINSGGPLIHRGAGVGSMQLRFRRKTRSRLGRRS